MNARIPQYEDDERVILAAILAAPDLTKWLLGSLSKSDFYIDDHRAIFSILPARLHKLNVLHEYSEALRKEGVRSNVQPNDLENAAGRVREAAARRRLIEVFDRLSVRMLDKDDEISAVQIEAVFNLFAGGLL